MKDKKYKYLEDLIEDYLRLTDEQIEIPHQISKTQEKFEALLRDHEGEFAEDDAQYAFKLHTQLKKYEENRKDLAEELTDLESILKDFLKSLGGSKVAYEKKDDNKTKITYLFWLEEEELKSNRH